MFRGPEIEKLDGELGGQSRNDDNVLGLCCGGVTTANYATLGAVVKLIQPTDADAYGFNAAYDIANKILVRHHINEFFRRNPAGVLWLQVVAQTVTMTQMCDKANAYLTKIISESVNTVKNLGVVRNPATGYTPTLTNGIDADVLTAIPKAQQLVDDYVTRNVFIENIVIEGRQVNGLISSIKDMRTMASPNVQVAILQDPDVASLDALFAKYADVGLVLGDIGIRRCEEDLGALDVLNKPNKGIQDYPINSAADGIYLKVAISSGTETKNLTAAEVKLLKDYGYIFADLYPEYPGVFLSGSPTCTDLASDFAWSAYVRTWCKAARIAVKKLTPKFNSTVETDAATGKMKSTTIASWTLDVNNTRNGVGTMVVDAHCQASRVTIDPNQNVRTTKKVIVKVGVQPYDYPREIVGQIALSIN